MSNAKKAGGSRKPETEQSTQETIASRVTDIIASESVAGVENIGRVSWFGAGLILLTIVYFVTSNALETQAEILIAIALVYIYQCAVIFISTISRISQKAASILGVLAMFTVTYEESGLNIMRAFFDGISKAAESSATEDSRAKTEV